MNNISTSILILIITFMVKKIYNDYINYHFNFHDFKNKKFDKEMALGLLNETQSHWCDNCDNYKENACGCYFPAFKQEMIKKINEHFDNPPLKFEEVKAGMWVWYNNKYRKVYKVDKENNVVVLVETGYLKPIEYEENKFYRYEVHGNETKI